MRLLRAALGVLVPLALTGVIAALRAHYSSSFLYLYLPALLLIAYAGGLVPGVLATAVSAVLAAWFFLDAPSVARFAVLPTALFMASGVLLAVAGVRTRQYQERLREDLQQSGRQKRDETFLREVTDLLAVAAGGEAVAQGVSAKCAAHFRRPAAVLLRESPGEELRLAAGNSADVGWAERRARDEGVGVWIDRLQREGARLAALQAGAEALGYLAIHAPRERAWDQSDERLLQAVADRTAFTLHRLALRAQRQRRERDNRFLADLLTDSLRQQDLSDLLEVIARRCTDVFGEWCGIELIEAEHPGLRLGAVYHRDPSRVPRLEAAPARSSVGRDHPLVARILQGRAPIVLDPQDEQVRAAAADLPLFAALFAQPTVPPVLAVPIFGGPEPVGILSLGAAASGRWEEEDLRLAALVADRTGAAIVNARLVEAERRAREGAERETRRLNAVSRITAIAARSLDLGAAFAELAEALQLLLPFVRVRVSLHDVERDWMTMPYFVGPPLGASPETREGPRAGTIRGLVLDTAQPFIRADTQGAQEFEEDRALAAVGIRSFLVVPMTVGGRTIGTLDFGHHAPGFYTADHARLMEPIADQLAITISRFQLFEQAQRRAGLLSEALQRSLLPAELPRAPFTAIAALYRPADPETSIGGDWYDALELPDDRILVSIGDVAGHGVAAAAAMGQARHVVRAYAVEGRTPAQILGALNRFVSLVPGSAQLSLWVGMLDPFTGDLTYGAAGHPPPYLLTAGRTVPLAASGPPLGISPDVGYEEGRTHLPPGTRIVAYTDGLIEATRDIVEGERRLLAALTATAEASPARAVEGVLTQVLGEARPHDDIALLVLDMLPITAPLFLSVAATPQNLQRVRRAARAFAHRLGVGRARAEEMVLAVGEAVVNVVEHAYGGRPGTVTIKGEVRGQTLTFSVQDFGRWQPPRDRGRGHGTQIMRGLSEQMEVYAGPVGTVVELTWALSDEPRGAGRSRG